MWDDFDEEFRRMHKEMDRMFENLGVSINQNYTSKQIGQGTALPRKQEAGVTKRLPLANVYETETAVVASVELPGVEKKQIELNLTDHYLEVRVASKSHQSETKKGYTLEEARSSEFYRRLPLPCEVDANGAKATFENGLLRVEIPKKQNKEGKKRLRID